MDIITNICLITLWGKKYLTLYGVSINNVL